MCEKACKNTKLVPILVVLSLLVIFFLPRLIVGSLGVASPWTSYFYQYGLGALVFGIGLLLIRKTGSCVPGRGRDGFWYKWLLAGFVIFATVHAIWIYLALSIPVKGGA